MFVVSRLCEDCGAHAQWQLVSSREVALTDELVASEAGDRPVVSGACDQHRLDATESMLNQYGNVTITETLG